MSLSLCPVTMSEANAFVKQHHRHHGKVAFHILSVAVFNTESDKIVGVAIVGRPCAIALDDGWTAEVTRLCTDGTKNACSMLYSAAWRAVKALGYKKLVTYILNTENGASLKAAGWKCIGECGGGTWVRRGRPRVDKHPTQKKLRWEVDHG